MPSVRFSRDKRGYEYVYLVHTPVRRGRPGRQRLLYWYRTPPGVAIGRKPFDEEVRRTLERQYPSIPFDWDAIVSTPLPPPDRSEFWRERRRAERAAKQERRAAEAGESDAAVQQPLEPGAPEDLDTAEPLELVIAQETTGDAAVRLQVVEAEPLTSTDPAGEGAAGGQPGASRRRRRRGRRRRGSVENESSGTPAVSDEATDGADEDLPLEPDDPESEEG